MAARERAGRPSRFGGFVGRPWGRAGGPELAAQQHHRAAACAASSAHKSRHEGGQRPSGHRPRGATADVATKGARRDICAALEPLESAGHALFAVSPTSPRGHKSIRLRPFETNTKGGGGRGAEDSPLLRSDRGRNDFECGRRTERTFPPGSTRGNNLLLWKSGGRGKRIELHRPHERDA